MSWVLPTLLALTLIGLHRLVARQRRQASRRRVLAQETLRMDVYDVPLVDDLATLRRVTEEVVHKLPLFQYRASSDAEIAEMATQLLAELGIQVRDPVANE